MTFREVELGKMFKLNGKTYVKTDDKGEFFGFMNAADFEGNRCHVGFDFEVDNLTLTLRKDN